VALGYPTWDAYVDARFGDFRIAIPREHRQQAVAALVGVRMSVRAIASLLGVGVGTVHREMVSLSGVPDGTPDGEDQSSTLGMDGKQYPRRRHPSAASRCVTCGETHPAGTKECPWDLVAQGRAPRPKPSRPGPEDEALDAAVEASGNTEPEVVQPKPPVRLQESVEHAESQVADCAVEGDLTEVVERAQFLLAAIADLVLLVNDIQVAVTSSQSASETEPSAARVREVASCLRQDLTGIQGLIERLESVADGLHPR